MGFMTMFSPLFRGNVFVIFSNHQTSNPKIMGGYCFSFPSVCFEKAASDDGWVFQPCHLGGKHSPWKLATSIFALKSDGWMTSLSFWRWQLLQGPDMSFITTPSYKAGYISYQKRGICWVGRWKSVKFPEFLKVNSTSVNKSCLLPPGRHWNCWCNPTDCCVILSCTMPQFMMLGNVQNAKKNVSDKTTLKQIVASSYVGCRSKTYRGAGEKRLQELVVCEIQYP